MRSWLRLGLPFVILTVATVAGCATPAPLVELSPRTAKDIVWVAGRAVVSKEKGGVRVATAFEHQDGAMLALRFEVENLTPAALEVAPINFFFMPCPTSDNESCQNTYTFIDPEEAIRALDETESRERADAENEQALNTSLVLLSAVGDVASVASGHANSTTGLTTVAIAGQGEADAARAEASVGSIANRRDVWSNAAFRRTTIAPGRGASGLVYMPIATKARYVWIYYQVGGQTFSFGFVQDVQQLVTSGAPPARND